MRTPGEPVGTGMVRLLVQSIVAFGLAGTAVDLVLTGHYESPQQFVPFAAVALALVALAWHWRGGRRSILVLRVAMVMLLAAGAAGTWFHYHGSREFQLESDPSAAGLALWSKVFASTAPPVLAPMTMALLGMFGLASLHGMPARDADRETDA